MSNAGSNRSRLRTYFTFAAYIYFTLLALFIPIGFFPYQQEIVDLIFEKILVFLSQEIFSLHLVNPQISSDSTLLYILAGLLLPVSFLFAFLLFKFFKTPETVKNVTAVFFMFLILHLSWSMFNYGANKVFKLQFYSPEPNILYTPFGKLDKDILYWSTIGTSYPYNLFLGLGEVIAAALLLLKRTRALALLLCFFLSANIFAINLCFDISVKLYSAFLLITCAFLLSQHRGFFKLLAGKIYSPYQAPDWPFASSYIKYGIHLAFTAIVFLIYFLPALRSGHLNQDESPRHPLSGAYSVSRIIAADSNSVTQTIKKLFIHRRNFLIFQSYNDEMQDYKLTIDEVKKKFILTDYDRRQTEFSFEYTAADSTLTLQHLRAGHEFTLVAKAINWQGMPALQNTFHFTMDQPD